MKQWNPDALIERLTAAERTAGLLSVWLEFLDAADANTLSLLSGAADAIRFTIADARAQINTASTVPAPKRPGWTGTGKIVDLATRK